MSQDIFSNINPDTTSGTDLSVLLNSFKDAVASGFSGTARPANLQKGGYWVDTSLESGQNLFRYYFYNGTSDTLIFTINKVTGRILFPSIDGGQVVKKVSADTIPAILNLFKARAETGAPAQVLSGDVISQITSSSTDDTGAVITEVATIEAVATENHTGAAQGTKFNLYTKLSTTAVKFLQMTIGDVIEVFNNVYVKNKFVFMDADGSAGSTIAFRKSQGTFAAPTATQSGDSIGFVGARGYGATGFNGGSKANMEFVATENHTDTANGIKTVFGTTGNGTTTRKTRLTIDQDGGIIFHGNTSGTMTFKPAAAVTSYTLNWPAAQGGASTVLTNDGSGNLTWAAGGGGGANTTLSNLGTTDINADFITYNPNSGANTTFNFYTNHATAPLFDNRTPNMIISTGDNNFGNSGGMTVKTGYARLGGATRTSGPLLLTTGNGHTIGFSNDGNSGNTTLTTGFAGGFGTPGHTFVNAGSCTWFPGGNLNLGSGNSTNSTAGDINIEPGTGTGGVRGKVKFKNGSQGTAGHVLTSTGTDGEMGWAAPGGGGSSWTKYTIGHAALQAASLTNNAAVLTLPIKGIVEGILIKTTTAFAGSGITSYNLTVGIIGNESKYLPTFDADAAVAGGNYAVSSIAVGGEDLGATEAIKVFATAVGANLDQSSAGSVDIYVKVATLP